MFEIEEEDSLESASSKRKLALQAKTGECERCGLRRRVELLSTDGMIQDDMHRFVRSSSKGRSKSVLGDELANHSV